MVMQLHSYSQKSDIIWGRKKPGRQGCGLFLLPYKGPTSQYRC